MNNVLMIPNANFFLNRVDTVDVEVPVPCVGLELSQSSLSMTSVGSTQTLTATLTPVNTTDVIVWESSNTQVASVSQFGVVTQTGVGSATISATCGAQVAACSVSCTVVYHMEDDFITINNAAGYVSADEDYVRWVASANGYRQYISNEAAEYPVYNKQSNVTAAYKGKTAIPLPVGAVHMSITNPNASLFDWFYIYFIDSDQPCTGASTNDSARVTLRLANIDCAGVQTMELNLGDYNIGSANSFLFSFYDKSSSQISGDMTCTITITS